MLKKIILVLNICIIPTFYYAQSQTEMNIASDKNFQKADKELNRVYQKILTLPEYKQDKAFIESLKKSQRIWIQFRDAEVLAKYPHQNERAYYGSIFPTCLSNYKEELTLERIKKLKIWLEGIEEGDGCSGSVKFK